MQSITRSYCLPSAARRVELEAALAQAKGAGRLSTGCPIGEEKTSLISCDPEAMRKKTEELLRRWGFYSSSKRLTMDVYAMARNIASEAGSGTGAEKIAIGEALVNRAREKRVTMFSLMTRDGHFGRQYGCNPCVSSARDPSWEDIYTAELVLSGKSGNLIKGATHYYAPADQDAMFRSGRDPKDALTVYDKWTAGSSGALTWVGYIPGIDIRRQFFMKASQGPVPADWRATGRAAVTAKMPPGIFDAKTCGAGSTLAVVGVGMAVSTLVAFFFINLYGEKYEPPWASV